MCHALFPLSVPTHIVPIDNQQQRGFVTIHNHITQEQRD